MAAEQAPPRIVVMGVSGCGKSTVAQALAQRLGLPFIEGDELHPPRNVARMAAGTPLTDDDRQGWLEAVADRLAAAADTGAVATCSALKRGYRDLLRARVPGLRWVYLAGEPALLAQRLRTRSGHYMPASLLQSQLDTLEPPRPDEAPITVTIALSPERIVEQVCLALDAARRAAAPSPRPDPLPMQFTKVILETGPDGRARFRDEAVPLTEGKPAARLSPLMPSGGLQLRMSPVGFRSEFHCTETPQWLFVLGGQMEIGLQGGISRVFGPGDHFYSADTLPAGATFDPAVHGHWSRQVGPDPLVTAFVRAA